MAKFSTCLIFNISVLISVVLPGVVAAQLSAGLNTTDNTNCDGAPCNYSGPSIIINELMLSPSNFDGSMWGGTATQGGEWIELYNPNICEEIDISCYYLGNNANDGAAYPGGYVIPPGTVVPPAGFALIRGINAAPVPANRLVANGGNVVELVVTGDGVCVGGGSRLWFPNAGGWFAFYDNNGVPQDAVSWASSSNIGQSPCVPTLPGCSPAGALSNYTDFPADRKNYILNTSAANFQGQSLRRIPDGGAWSTPGAPTYAACNAACINPQNVNCNGTATAIPSGGSPPYAYLWDDPRAQTTQTADQLCAGTYCVEITDALSNTVQQCITVEDGYYETQINAGFCSGNSYTLPDNSTVSVPGTYNFSFQNANGCDSLITVELVEYPTYSYNLSPEICNNQTYTLPDGTAVNTTGNYVVNFATVNGCDSVYNVNLTVLPPFDVSLNPQICPGSTYLLPDGTIVGAEGNYQVLMPGGAAACDTLYTINLEHFDTYTPGISQLNNISCFGASDGSASLTINPASGPYIFTWSDGGNYGLSPASLGAGNYILNVEDVNGCETSVNFDILEPDLLSLNATADELICIGTSSQLSAQANGGTGPYAYNWSHTSQTLSSNAVNPNEDTDYSVYATDANGCNSDTITLSVAVISMNPDSLEILSGEPVCAGGSITLQANYSGNYPPYTYTWNQGLPDGPGPHTVSPPTTTDYELTVSDQCGNEVSQTATITIWPLPIAQVAPEDISCNGANDGSAVISLSQGTPGYVFSWSDGFDHGANPNDLAPGNYDVNISDANGCATSLSFTIVEPELLSISATADTLICIGTSSQLSAQANGGTGPYAYNWSHTAQTLSSNAVSPNEDTDYSVYATDANGCNSDTITLSIAVISMNPASLEILSGEPVCAGGSSTVQANYNGNYPPYIYSWNQGLPDGPGPHTVSPPTTTDYELTVSDQCGNEVSQTATITIWPLPIAQVVIEDISCNGANDGSAAISLSQGTPDYVFFWSDGVDHGPNADDLPPGTYNMDISDANGCATSVSFTITEPELLSISATADTLICIGNASQLSAQASGGVGNYSYSWSHTLATDASSEVSPIDDTDYSVFATDSNGCQSPTITLSVDVIAMDLALLELIGGGSICEGAETTIQAFYNGAYPPYSYQWSPGELEGPGPHSVNPEETANYQLIVTDICGNSLIDEIEITVNPLPEVSLPNGLINGCSPLTAILADSINTGQGFIHEWIISNGTSLFGNPVDLELDDPGTYEVQLVITSPQGCSDTSDTAIPVEVFELPVANFSASAWTTEIDGAEISFTNTGSGYTTSIWNLDGTTFEDQLEISYEFPDTGRYAVQLIVENEFGCLDSLTRWVTIEVVHDVTIPNAFTPGGGGDNPYYDPNSTSNTIFYPFFEYVSEYRMSIFNRWGELIFESNETAMGWNGTYRGAPCPQDVYVYRIDLVFTDGYKTTKVGDVTLFR